jgi:2,3,4,5-tetrahydropyridine-2-carboxylate N-succinyltransferase
MVQVDTREDAVALLDALERGELRAAEPDERGGWQINEAVKAGILQVFRLGENQDAGEGLFRFHDRDLLIPRCEGRPGVRIVPGGTVIRRGAHVGADVVIMPPAYVNVGAFVDCGTTIDSHALVGSCAQVGRNVHVSAAVQIGGVLEPIGASPVIVEDDAFLGGNSGVYDGVRVGAGAVLAAGVVLTSSTTVYDLVNKCQVEAMGGVLQIPPNAVVVPGTRPASGAYARQQGLSLSAALIVKYRDSRTDARTTLEKALRQNA